jgi:hypothetical protein
MKSAIRLIVNLMMAATSVAAFAEGNDAATPAGEGDQQSEQSSVKMSGTGVGAVSHESSISSSTAEAREEEKTAIEEYNQRKFVEQNWMPLP